MRKKLLYNMLGVFAVLVAFTSCDEQDVSAPIGTDDYPTATFTTDFTGTEINEGDMITYQITLDKVSEQDQTFTLKTSGTADMNDVSYPEEVVIPAYTTHAEFVIEFTADNYPEVAETFSFELGEFKLATRYFLNPNTVNPKMDLTIVNKNVETGLTIAMKWVDPEEEIDFDLFLIHKDAGDIALSGSSDNPEIMVGAIEADYPDGDYYVTVDPYAVPAGMTSYTIAVGLANQEVQTFEASFDNDNKETLYPIDYFAYWGTDSYRLMTITKAGDAFTFTPVE